MSDRFVLRAGLAAAVVLTLVGAVPVAAWDLGPATPFAYMRFDAGYFPGLNKVYFLGGRLNSTDTDGSVWSFDADTGIYEDTGVDLPVPISNYTMNLVHDANGWGFYVFCGRNSAGTTVRTVQIYYPGTNTVAALPAADDFPNALGCLGGLNVVFEDKVWLAGGFHSTMAPYNHAQTWVFDPMAASGSRWTQIASANLTTARSYIMGALFDGKIYAIGGSWYDAGSASLINVPTVEVLDPRAAAPTWSDAAVADLPEGCSEGRAWALDHRAAYLTDEGGNAGGYILTTCGGWSAESERTYLFDSGNGSWSLWDPLSSPRRDQAAELLFPSSGAPGFWMWGGRSGSDTTPVTTAEVTPLAASNCRLMLVDDDWDFTSTHSGAYPYYWTTLDLLGYTGVAWSTELQGPPSTADLAPFKATVWYTGYDWQLAVDATEEAELLGYLDGGGGLFLSALDQIYAGGLTPLLQDYMGVGSYVEDVAYRQLVGNPGDPVFTGFGPYLLARPDDWDVYWPAAPTEGPYTDEVHATPGGGGIEALLWDPQATPNTVRREGPTYRTMFLGWPFEWVDTITERAELMGNALHWICPILEDGFETGDTTHWSRTVP